MKFATNITHFASGGIVASMYKGKDHIALEFNDETCGNAVSVFVSKKYEKHLEKAINAFNAVWEQVESEHNLEHE